MPCLGHGGDNAAARFHQDSWGHGSMAIGCSRAAPMPELGFLAAVSPGPFAQRVAAFHRGLNETGFVEGQNLAIESRWAEEKYDRLPAMAADLVDRRVR